VIIAGSVLLSACSSAPIAGPASPSKPSTASAAETRTGSTASSKVDPLNDPKGDLAKRSVYFDYDRYSVKTDDRATLEAHARYLSAHKDHRIMIQGNADERGGSEYNLALGQKRAEAVRKSMQLLGVQESQMEAVSFGKEKPKAEGHDEAAWAENRRADLAY
jgi:peptidoglycan-associated lipoprotein